MMTVTELPGPATRALDKLACAHCNGSGRDATDPDMCCPQCDGLGSLKYAALIEEAHGLREQRRDLYGVLGQLERRVEGMRKLIDDCRDAWRHTDAATLQDHFGAALADLDEQLADIQDTFFEPTTEERT